MAKFEHLYQNQMADSNFSKKLLGPGYPLMTQPQVIFPHFIPGRDSQRRPLFTFV